MSGPRYCAGHRCMQVVSPGKLMCAAHWFSVPEEARKELWASWRAYQRIDFKVMSPERRGKLTTRYSEAVRAAIAHTVNVRLTPDAAKTATARTSDGATVSYDQGRLL